MKGSTRKEDAPQKLVARIEYEHKIHKVKKVVLPASPKITRAPIAPPVVVTCNFDETKMCCKARKRKERQESITSLCQDRKVIRSNSEERPLPKKNLEPNTTIRRVSSSGDFPKSGLLEKLGGSPQKNASPDKLLTYEDHEHEKRRSHERFARPQHKAKKPPGKRLRVRYNSKSREKENGRRSGMNVECTVTESYSYSFGNTIETSTVYDSPKKKNLLQLNEKEKDKDRTQSPPNTPISPVLDFSTLLEQVEASEPILSNSNPYINDNTETMPSLSIATNRSMLSPRNSIIATHKIYLDPDVPQTNISIEKMTNGRMQKLNKQINSQKKKIKNCEAEFEAQKGFKPSQIDKLNDTVMRKLYAELSKLKKEQKQLSDISASCSLMDFSGTLIQHGKPVSLQDTVNEIEQKLDQKRDAGRRAFNLDEMTQVQLAEEKLSMQKALLYLESVHGRPQNREDRDIVRPFYDRYRTLKRMVAKNSSVGISGNELATIHENETMNFVTPTSSSNDTESERTDSTKPVPIPYVPPIASTDSDSESSSCSENFHSLSKIELARQLKIVTEEKKEMRKKIKEFEINIQVKTGRMITKEDKEPMQSVYSAYKQTKGKLKLLEALLAKK